MTHTYAIPDIHGRVDLLRLAFLTIVSREMGNPYTVVTLGDYVDRGPQSADVIRTLRQMQGLHAKDHPMKLVCLRGNHEDIMGQTVTRRVPYTSWWYQNGGMATMKSYGLGLVDSFRDAEARDDMRALWNDVRWANELPLYYEDEHRVYVHAGLIDEFGLDEQPDRGNGELNIFWHRYPKFPYADGTFSHQDVGYRGKHVVHGHDSHREPLLLQNRTDLDTRAYNTGILHVGVFEDLTPGGPVEVLEILP